MSGRKLLDPPSYVKFRYTLLYFVFYLINRKATFNVTVNNILEKYSKLNVVKKYEHGYYYIVLTVDSLCNKCA